MKSRIGRLSYSYSLTHKITNFRKRTVLHANLNATFASKKESLMILNHVKLEQAVIFIEYITNIAS